MSDCNDCHKPRPDSPQPLRVKYRVDKPVDPRYQAHWDSLFRHAITMPVYRIERDEK